MAEGGVKGWIAAEVEQYVADEGGACFAGWDEDVKDVLAKFFLVASLGGEPVEEDKAVWRSIGVWCGLFRS